MQIGKKKNNTWDFSSLQETTKILLGNVSLWLFHLNFSNFAIYIHIIAWGLYYVYYTTVNKPKSFNVKNVRWFNNHWQNAKIFLFYYPNYCQVMQQAVHIDLINYFHGMIKQILTDLSFTCMKKKLFSPRYDRPLIH